MSPRPVEQVVLLYRNGLTQFIDTWELATPEMELSFPVLLSDAQGRNHVQELYRTFQVFGPVQTVKPLQHVVPRDILLGANRGDSLEGNLFEFLANQFVGAEVEITYGFWGRKIKGRLSWSTPDARAKLGGMNFVIETAEGLKPVPFSKVKSIRLLDSEDDLQFQQLVSAQRMKRGENFAEAKTALQGQVGAQFKTSYTLSGLPPQFSYRLTQEGKDKPTVLVGLALIENNFASSWENVTLRIPTTLPFGGDVNARGHEPSHRQRGHGGRSYDRMDAYQTRAGNETMMFSPDMLREMQRGERVIPDANVESLGDGHVFSVQSKLTLAPGGSALAELFSETLEQPRSVLHRNDNGSILRAMAFRFAGNFVLPTARCMVFQNSMGDGEGELKLTRPGQSRIVAHAEQQGFTIEVKTPKARETTISCLGSDDEILLRTRTVQETKLRVDNRTRAKHTLIYDHKRALSGDEATISCEQAKGPSVERTGGVRFEFQISDEMKITEIVIVETKFTEQRLNFAQAGINLAEFVERYVLRSNDDELMKRPEFLEVSELLATLRKSRTLLQRAEETNNAREARIQKLQQDLRAVGDAEFGTGASLKEKLLELRSQCEEWEESKRNEMLESIRIDEGKLAAKLQKLKMENLPATPKRVAATT